MRHEVHRMINGALSKFEYDEGHLKLVIILSRRPWNPIIIRNKINLEHVLVDAMPLPDLDIKHTPIIKGDFKSISIAAASVIAKVTRDRELYELDEKYPMYGFKSHKGYPTKKHIEAIKKYGLIDGYRKISNKVSDIIHKEKENFNEW